MQRPQSPEARPFKIQIENREGELPGDNVAHQKSGKPPKHRGDDAGADDAVGIAGLFHRRRLAPETVDEIDPGHGRSDHQDRAGNHHPGVSPGHRPDKSDCATDHRPEESRSVGKGVHFFAL